MGLSIGTGLVGGLGGGSGGGTTSGTFTAAANPVIPFPAGHTKFQLWVSYTSNAVQADGQGLNWQTSVNADGSSPDTASHYLAVAGSNSATSPNSNFFNIHWSGTTGGA